MNTNMARCFCGALANHPSSSSTKYREYSISPIVMANTLVSDGDKSLKGG
jgi:hypothetical protein